MEITEGIANFARSEGIGAIPIMFSLVLACTVSEDNFSAIRFIIRVYASTASETRSSRRLFLRCPNIRVNWIPYS